MTRTNQHQEPFKMYTVIVSGKKQTWHVEQSARTEWEAIDRVFTRFKDIAPDRSDYTIKKKDRFKGMKNEDILNYLNHSDN